MTKALFLDRDGVINIDYGHVYLVCEFKVYDKIYDICREYQNNGYLIIVISNQAGIAKGLYNINDLNILDKHMKKVFSDNGINIVDSFYCPHGPNDNCDCRKPKPGLLLKAKDKYDIDLASSVLIGDKISDLQAGYNAGIKKLYFHKTKYEETEVCFDYEYINY